MGQLEQIRLVLDNIVFSLQKTGGGSVYWANLEQSCVDDERFDVAIIEREDAAANLSRQSMDIGKQLIVDAGHIPLRLDEVRSVPSEVHGLFHSSFYRFGKGRSCINVTTVHDFICMKQYSGLLKWFSFWQIARAVKHSKAVICITESTKQDLLHYLPSAKEKLIEVIHQGFDNRVYTYEPCERLNQVVFIGARKVGYKNFKAAVESVSLLPHTRLIIIGSPLSSEEEAMLSEALPGRFEATGFLPASDICNIFRSSIALLYLSEYEGFGVPPLEAMASGLPVIALNRSSIPEVVGDAAILLENANPEAVAKRISELLVDKDLFRNLVSKGLDRASLFSWERTADKTKEFYRRVWRQFG